LRDYLDRRARRDHGWLAWAERRAIAATIALFDAVWGTLDRVRDRDAREIAALIDVAEQLRTGCAHALRLGSNIRGLVDELGSCQDCEQWHEESGIPDGTTAYGRRYRTPDSIRTRPPSM
jgi:hypothetical protein